MTTLHIHACPLLQTFSALRSLFSLGPSTYGAMWMLSTSPRGLHSFASSARTRTGDSCHCASRASGTPCQLKNSRCGLCGMVAQVACTAPRRGTSTLASGHCEERGLCLLTGRLLMCTFLPGGERPFFFVGGVGISVVGSVATFIRTSQSHGTTVECNRLLRL